MSKLYDVQYTHVIEREVTCVVRADSEDDAIKKAREGDEVDNDEDDCTENGIEIKDYKCLGESEYVEQE